MPYTYKRLDPELMQGITKHIRERLQVEEDARPDSVSSFLNSIPGGNRAAAPPDCRERTRRTLERIHDGTATNDEAAVVRRAVLYMNKHPERQKDNRRLHTLTMRYLASRTMTVAELATSFNVDKSTIYRDIDAAIARLSVLLYASDGVL